MRSREHRLSIATALYLSFAFAPFADAWSVPWPRIRSRDGSLRKRNTTTIAAPIVVAPSQYWDGVDGPWSSFALQVGTPTQNVRVFISTAADFTWTIDADGCPPSYPSSCSNSRGFIFNTNQSLTWVPNSIYQLGLEDNLGLDTTANVGFDTVTLGWQGAGGPNVQHSPIFNMGSSVYWIGGFGLNPRPINFTNLNDPQPAFLTALKNNNSIPSISYGYTAGNQYRFNQVYGSLTLGGYDQNRFEPTNVTFPFYEDISRDLLVYLKSVTSGRTNLLPGGPISILIDSTVPMIYLPLDACQAFEEAFGLVWNSQYNLYLINSTQRSTLQTSNPSVTFMISPNSTTGVNNVNITLPYAAFDLQIGFPYIENPNSSYYFPLQRAENDTQYTLGRTFLQEAYLIADYERQNFTVAPCAWDQNKVNTANIAAILSPSDAAAVKKPNSGGGISAGAIAGVVIGIVAVIALLGLALFLLRRRKLTAKRHAAELEAKTAGGVGLDDLAAKHGPPGTPGVGSGHEGKPFLGQPASGELGGGEVHELTAPYKPFAQEMDTPGNDKLHPHHANTQGYSEMEGGEYFAGAAGKPGPGQQAHEMSGHPVYYEMPGSEVQEMPTPDRRSAEK